MASHPRHRPAQPSVVSSRVKPVQQSLARRLLFHSLPSQALPPLFVAHDVPDELTEELYDFIALALRAYVNPWWTRITRYDKELLPHITHILSVVLRALEIRLEAVDLPALAFHDLPAIIHQHYSDYRNAASKLSTSYASGGASSLPVLFHQLQPHMALNSDGTVDQEYVRQILDHVLKSCLPPEDYEPESERLIIREVILKVLLVDVLPRITQPWFVQRAILNLLGSYEEKTYPLSTASPPSTLPLSFSFHTLLVIVLSAVQSFSGLCLALIHTYKQAVSTIKLVNKSPTNINPMAQPHSLDIPDNLPSPISASFSVAEPLQMSSSASTSSSLSLPLQSITQTNSAFAVPDTRFNYIGPLIAMLSEVFLINDRFMSAIVMITFSMVSYTMTNFLDKLLPYVLTAACTPTLFLNIARTAKQTMFPNGSPGPQPPDPSLEEQAQIRAQLVAWRPKGGAAWLYPIFLGEDPSATIDNAIEPLSSAECNVHLVMLILDKVVASLFPELLAASS